MPAARRRAMTATLRPILLPPPLRFPWALAPLLALLLAQLCCSLCCPFSCVVLPRLPTRASRAPLSLTFCPHSRTLFPTQIIVCCCGGFAVACASCCGRQKAAPALSSGGNTTVIVTGGGSGAAAMVQGNPLSAHQPQQHYGAPHQHHAPPLVTWSRHSDGKDTWYVSSAGETSWTLPAGAVCH